MRRILMTQGRRRHFYGRAQWEAFGLAGPFGCRRSSNPLSPGRPFGSDRPGLSTKGTAMNYKHTSTSVSVGISLVDDEPRVRIERHASGQHRAARESGKAKSKEIQARGGLSAAPTNLAERTDGRSQNARRSAETAGHDGSLANRRPAPVSDLALSVVADEPRVRDIDLAERLGFDRPRKIRDLIKANIEELQAHGILPSSGAKSRDAHGRGRPGLEYWLNEPQALLVCMFSRTANAARVRKMLIEVFMEWRHGRLDEVSPVQEEDDGLIPVRAHYRRPRGHRSLMEAPFDYSRSYSRVPNGSLLIPVVGGWCLVGPDGTPIAEGLQPRRRTGAMTYASR